MPDRSVRGDGTAVADGVRLVLDLLDSQHRAGFLIDPASTVCACNRTAEGLARSAPGLLAGSDKTCAEAGAPRLEFADPAMQRGLVRALAELARGAGPQAFAASTAQADERTGPLPGAHPPALAEVRRVGRDMRLLVVTLLDGHIPALEGRLRLVFGLTAREAAVAAELVSDAGEETIAIRLGISPNTLRSHRKTIYAKLGVGSRAGLAALLCRLP